MNIVTGCSGIDAIALAAELIDIKLIGQIEIDDFCNKILEFRYPGVKRLKNIFDVRGDEFGTNVDIFAAGIPCQEFSVAGKRKGDKGDRYLWPEAIRIIRVMQPNWIIIENVFGITSMERSDGETIMETETVVREESEMDLLSNVQTGKRQSKRKTKKKIIVKEYEMVLETIRKDLENAGYESVTIIIPACSVGAKHQRYRVIIVANDDSCRYMDGKLEKQSAKREEQTLIESFDCNSSKTLGNSECIGCGGQLRGRTEQEPENGYSRIETMADTGSKCARGLSERKREKNPGTYDSGKNVANSTGERLQKWQQTGRWENAEKAGTRVEPEFKRCSEDVADTCSSRWKECNITSESTEPGYNTGSSYEKHARNGDNRQESGGICNRAAKSRMGGNVDGLSNRLYESGGQENGSGIFETFEEIFTTVLEQIQWPAGYGAEQHDYEPPRVATGVKNRANRLKALGNAIVWQQIFPILLAIKLIESEA